MVNLLQPSPRISPAQLRRLQALWRRWTSSLALSPEADRRLRHYYVQLFSGGRAEETKELTRADAARVSARLQRLSRRREPKDDRAAGTAGRRGFPEQRWVRPSPAAWRALWAVARALGMNRQRLDQFIRSHYVRAGLRGIGDLHTMADLNRVLWGLKAMLRRRPRGTRAAHGAEKRAA
jgi:hypothetical protein